MLDRFGVALQALADVVDGDRNERLDEVGLGLREVRDTQRRQRLRLRVPQLVCLMVVLVVGLIARRQPYLNGVRGFALDGRLADAEV